MEGAPFPRVNIEAIASSKGSDTATGWRPIPVGSRSSLGSARRGSLPAVHAGDSHLDRDQSLRKPVSCSCDWSFSPSRASMRTPWSMVSCWRLGAAGSASQLCRPTPTVTSGTSSLLPARHGRPRARQWGRPTLAPSRGRCHRILARRRRHRPPRRTHGPGQESWSTEAIFSWLSRAAWSGSGSLRVTRPNACGVPSTSVGLRTSVRVIRPVPA